MELSKVLDELEAGAMRCSRDNMSIRVDDVFALIAAAREGWRLREAYKRCEVCERTVDTREQTDGGDPHGCQLESGEWVCSHECYEETLTPTPEPQICTRCKRPIYENGGGMCFGCAELTD